MAFPPFFGRRMFGLLKGVCFTPAASPPLTPGTIDFNPSNVFATTVYTTELTPATGGPSGTYEARYGVNGVYGSWAAYSPGQDHTFTGLTPGTSPSLTRQIRDTADTGTVVTSSAIVPTTKTPADVAAVASYFATAQAADANQLNQTTGGGGSPATANNDPVGRLQESVYTYNATADGERPLLKVSGNSKWLAGNGTSSRMIATIADISQPNRMYLGVRFTDSSVGRIVEALGVDGRQLVSSHTSGYLIFAGQVLVNGTIATGTKLRLKAFFNGASSTITVDGSVVATGDAGTQSTGTSVSIFANTNSATDVFNGDLFSKIYTDGTESAADEQILNEWVDYWNQLT
jgi:hypothetical protein